MENQVTYLGARPQELAGLHILPHTAHVQAKHLIWIVDDASDEDQLQQVLAAYDAGAAVIICVEHWDDPLIRDLRKRSFWGPSHRYRGGPRLYVVRRSALRQYVERVFHLPTYRRAVDAHL